jgi:hypothetical protein
METMSGRNFYAARNDSGKLVNGTSREQAEAWWRELQEKGERAQLIETTSRGDEEGTEAARKLVAKYPDAAIPAIEAGIAASTHEGTRGSYVEIAGGLPGTLPLAFLRGKLGPATGVYSRVQAAEALFARGQPGTVPAVVQAWESIQPRLKGDQKDAYGEVGRIIEFLVRSGDSAAIDALSRRIRSVPVDVRLAIIQAILPPSKSSSFSSNGPSVHARTDIAKLPPGETSKKIEQLLLSELDDKEQRLQMQGHFDDFPIKDPRLCDIAALALALRWPEKYSFHWSAAAQERDAQISEMRARSSRRR